MIRCYLLPVETINGTETVAGIDLIHDAVLEGTDDPNIRKLLMYTTPEEHTLLVAVAGDTWPATQEELDAYHASVQITPPDPDTIRANEILATSPAAITQPEMWELLRIFGRRLGYLA